VTDVDADALKDLVRRANFLPYLRYGSPHDLSILEKISGCYLAEIERMHAEVLTYLKRHASKPVPAEAA
jgi:hypothetical protein